MTFHIFVIYFAHFDNRKKAAELWNCFYWAWYVFATYKIYLFVPLKIFKQSVIPYSDNFIAPITHIQESYNLYCTYPHTTMEMCLTSTLGQKKKQKKSFQIPELTKSGPVFPPGKRHISVGDCHRPQLLTCRERFCLTRLQFLAFEFTHLEWHRNISPATSTPPFLPPPSLFPTATKKSTLILPLKEI